MAVLALVLGGVLLHAVVSHAQITLDGSLGPAGALTGPNFQIPSTVGQVRGANLFHSFGRFNIQTNESATFTGPSSIANILARVTGGERSLIDGVLRSQISGANFFLMNPSGIMFGPNATLDVSGSFHATTADVIRFADGGTFFANPNMPSVLTVASPAAFGFLSGNPASITVQESVLEVPDGKSLSLVGGNVSIVGGPTGLIRARSGRVTVISVASPGEVSFDATTQAAEVAPGAFTRMGTVELSDAAFVSTTGLPDGPGSGTIVIRGGRLVMRDSDLRGNTNGDIDGARVGIDVRMSEEVNLTNSNLLTGSFAGGRAGDITVAAPVITFDNAGIESSANASGRAGDVTVTGDRLTVGGGSSIGSSTAASGAGGAVTVQATDSITVAGVGPSDRSRLISFTDDTGAGGTLTVSAPTVSIDGVVLTRSLGSGDAGDIVMNVGRLTLTNGTSFGGFTAGSGRAGNVTVNATESVSILDGTILSSTVKAGASGLPGRVLVTTPELRIDNAILGGLSLADAAAGDIDVRAQRVALTGGGNIAAGTASSGGGGTITIGGMNPGEPADLVSISGRGTLLGRSGITNETSGNGNAGRIAISARTLTVDDGTIGSNTFSGSGAAGDIDLNVGTLNFMGHAFVSSSTADTATGRGGSVTITASDSVSVSGGTILSAFSLGSGDAGRVSISTPSFSLTSGAALSTLAAGGGRAGNIAIDAGTVSIQGATIDSTTRAAGAGGNIDIRARDVDLRERAQIAADSSGTGNAGDISITASRSFRSHDSSITTLATQADGGDIRLNVGSVVQLVDSRITTSVQSGVGRGGNITIDPQAVVLNRSEIRADAFGGPGGNVSIVADVFLNTDSVVSASSALGVPGTIDVRASITDVSGGITQLPVNALQAATLLRASCAARVAEGKSSSLVVGAREGLPLEPGSVLPGHLSDDTARIGFFGPAESMPAELVVPPYRIATRPVLLNASCSR
jgi:filamentous hemagglutinin family protein